MTRNIALVGIGKIARDQHVPAITDDPNWQLAATVSRNASLDGIENYTAIEDMLSARPDIDTISLAIPPQPRFKYAMAALKAGRHVMLEKPPGKSLAEVHALEKHAEASGVTLYATWHSRHAHCVAKAKDWLADKAIQRLTIIWKEDVRRWHPGQDWVFEPGGLGVFDPGINALSIMTEVLPRPVHVTSATLEVPENRDTPIAAQLQFGGLDGAHISAEFDWRQEGPQTWDIVVETDSGTLQLSDGGAKLMIDGALADEGPNREYPRLYAAMHDLVSTGRSEVDLSPMVHVFDAYALGKHVTVEPFEF